METNGSWATLNIPGIWFLTKISFTSSLVVSLLTMQMKSTMENLGIDEEKLKNMSNEEVDQYVKEMCKKFGISQSLFDKLKDRFGK